MKYLQVILIGLIAFSCEKNTSNDQPVPVGNRKIKVIMESIHDPILKAGNFEVSPKLSKNSFPQESYFNQKGILLRKSIFNSKGNLESKILFKYDKNNNNIECIAYHSDGSLASKKVNKFDFENKLIESIEFDAREKITSKRATRYDSAGYRILTSYERASGRLVKTLESVFDKHENNVANYYFSDEELASTETKQYDVNGNLFETIQYYPLTNEQVITRFKYDKQNNIVGVVVLKNNLVTTKTIHRYDVKNNLTETFSYGVMGTLEGHHKYLYEFDAESNWTKRINVFNDQPTSVLRRRIEYF
jgi:hypothetical protein